jgi:tape measure domain-containing protein
MSNVGNLSASIRIDTRAAQAGLGQVRASVNQAALALRGLSVPALSARASLGGFGSAMAPMGALARQVLILGGAFGGLAAGIATVKSSLSAAADQEQLLTSFGVMLGSGKAAREMLEDLKQTAATTPFELPGISRAAKTLLAFQTPAAELVSTIRMLGDISAGTGKDLNELSVIFGQIRSAGRLTGQDMLQLINAGVPIISSLAERFGVTTAEIRTMVETGKVGFEDVAGVFQSLTGQGGMFFNMMEKQSQTMTGRISTLRDAIGEMQRQFGAPINEALKPLLIEATALAERLAPAAAAFGQNLAKAVTVLTNAFKEGRIAELFGLALSIGAREGINYLAGGLRTAVEALMSMMAVALKTLFSKDGLTGLVAAFAALGATLTSIFLRAFENPIRYFQAGIQHAVEKTMEFMGTKMGKVILTMLEALAPVLGSAKTALELAGMNLNFDGFKANSFEETLANTQASFGGKRAEEMKQAADNYWATATANMAKPMADLGKVLTDALKNFKPAEMFDTQELRDKWEKLIAELLRATGAVKEEAARTIAAAAPVASKAARTPEMRLGNDQLAAVGLFIGGTSTNLVAAAAEKTARNTELANKLLKQIADQLKPNYNPGGSLTFGGALA